MQRIESASKSAHPGIVKAWWFATRPRTLGIAVAPVVVGTVLAVAQGASLNLTVAIVAALAATCIQIGTNLQNDVGDFERGADAGERLGPARATTQGWLSPADVRRGVFVSFAAAFALGAYLVWYAGWVILAIGLASVAAGLAYTSGKRPIAYTGWGEAYVFVFFGLVATCGSYFLQAGTLSTAAWLAAAMLGFVAAAVLVVNNYRDRDSDARVGKRTLVVSLGRRFARIEYTALMAAPFAMLPALALSLGGRFLVALPLVALPWAAVLVWRFWRTPPGPEFNHLLAGTAKLTLVLALLVALAIAFA